MAKKILLAEDSVTMRQVVQMTFAGEDYAVTAVSTAEEALAQAKKLSPDIVIADLSLPGKNGYDLCAEIKRDGDRCPVLLLHGSGSKFDAGRARQVKADGELAKPFETQTLIEKVGDLVGGGARLAVSGPIESLSAPIESSEDLPVEPSLRRPAPAPQPRAVAPVAPPRPAPAIPLTNAPLAGSPLAGSPLAGSPAPRPIPLAPSRPAAPAPPVPASAAAFASNRPITIEAQPPPRSRPEPLQPFTPQPLTPTPRIESARPRPATTKLGLGGPALVPDLPPPPAGMPLPPKTGEQEVVPARVQATGGSSPGAVPLATAAGAAGVDPAVYEAITKLTREVVERIVWEVVPDLAETIIKEQLDRLIEKRAR